jgi:hypothetical protein
MGQPSTDQILEKYAQALGGPAAWEKVKTLTMKGTVEVPDDNAKGTAQIQAKAPGSFRLTMDIPDYGGMFETVLDGEHGWEKNPDSGMHAMSHNDLATAQRDHGFYRELRLKELYAKIELSPPDQLNGRSVNVLNATPASGPAEKLYFDAQSGLLVRRDFERVTLEDGIVQYQVRYADYRDVEGVKVAASVEQQSPDSTMIFKFAEIRANATLADTAFAKPEK